MTRREVGLRFPIVAFVVSMIGVSTVHAEPRKLTLADAIAIALAHNGDLYIAHADTEIAADEVALARSIFAPRLVSEIKTWRERQPSAVRFESSETRSSGSVEIDGRIPTGLTYALNFGAVAERINDPFGTIYNPAYTTSLSISLSQPLLRGAGGATRLPITVAARRRDLSEQQLRVRLEQIVGDVVVAYWSLVLAHKELEARDASLKLARDQLAESTRLVRVGTISDLDVIEARAGVGRQRQQLIRAQQAVTTAESKLRNLIVGDPSWKTDDTIFPTDDPEITQVPETVEEHLERARRNRPDIVAARAQLKVESATLASTKNGLLPSLDLVASGGLIGFAGQLERNYATSAIIDGPLDPPYVINSDFNGGVGRAFTNLARGDFFVSVGLRVELPIVNSAARARHDRQRHAFSRARIVEEALMAQIANQVRTSVTLLKADEQLKKAADEAVVDNEKLLKGMRKRFAGGLITSFDVLRVADELARAQIEAARARANYRVSLARLATVDGTLLQDLKISISSLRRPK